MKVNLKLLGAVAGGAAIGVGLMVLMDFILNYAFGFNPSLLWFIAALGCFANAAWVISMAYRREKEDQRQLGNLKRLSIPEKYQSNGVKGSGA